MADCSIEDCGKPSHAGDWCSKHYSRWTRTGDPLGLRGHTSRPKKTHCKHGHELAGDNLRIRIVEDREVQVCKRCGADSVRRVRNNQRAARHG